MASFKVSGIEELSIALGKCEDIPNNIVSDMLQAMGEVAKKAIESSAKAKGVIDTGLTIEDLCFRRRGKNNFFRLAHEGKNYHRKCGNRFYQRVRKKRPAGAAFYQRRDRQRRRQNRRRRHRNF